MRAAGEPPAADISLTIRWLPRWNLEDGVASTYAETFRANPDGVIHLALALLLPLLPLLLIAAILDERSLYVARPPDWLVRRRKGGTNGLVVLVAVPLPPLHAPPGVPPVLRRRRGASHAQAHTRLLLHSTRSSFCTIN